MDACICSVAVTCDGVGVPMGGLRSSSLELMKHGPSFDHVSVDMSEITFMDGRESLTCSTCIAESHLRTQDAPVTDRNVSQESPQSPLAHGMCQHQESFTPRLSPPYNNKIPGSSSSRSFQSPSPVNRDCNHQGPFQDWKESSLYDAAELTAQGKALLKSPLFILEVLCHIHAAEAAKIRASGSCS